MQENTEGTSAPTSEDIVKPRIACLAAAFSQQGSVHLTSPPRRRAHTETMGLGGGRLYPTQLVRICLGHHESKSNLPRRFSSQICPNREQSKRCPGRFRPPLTRWRRKGPWGRCLSQSAETAPSHRLFASQLAATQMHKTNPARRNKTCQ